MPLCRVDYSMTKNITGGLLVTSTVVATNAASLPFTGVNARTEYLLAPTTPQDFTALSKQIADGTTAGQELYLIGTSDTNYVVFSSAGTNMILNGDWIGGVNMILKLVWDGTKWQETGRNR